MMQQDLNQGTGVPLDTKTVGAKAFLQELTKEGCFAADHLNRLVSRVSDDVFNALRSAAVRGINEVATLTSDQQELVCESIAAKIQTLPRETYGDHFEKPAGPRSPAIVLAGMDLAGFINTCGSR